ncbi:MAG: bifunctional metallophosphatase/5'-nucleotidase [Oscillospiraceae bacterium]
MRITKMLTSAAVTVGMLLSPGSASFASGIEMPVIPVTPSGETGGKDIMILHVNDVHCAINADDSTFGYAELAAYEARLRSEGYTTLLVDAGDFVQGGVIGTLSDGGYIIDIMNELDFDVVTLGNHEFDYGMERLTELTDQADFEVVSSNFVSASNGANVYDSSYMVETDGMKLGFVGITTPVALRTNPSQYVDVNGEPLYDFCSGNNGQDLYDNVQDTVDELIEHGADVVIAIGHLGIEESCSPWTSTEVIANTSGIDLFIDGHSHTLENEKVADKDGNYVVLTSTGTGMQTIGAVTISGGDISAKLVQKDDYTVSKDVESAEYKAYENVSAYISDIEAQYERLVNTVVAKTGVTLTTMDPANPDERIIRNRETNLGDLCADAYRVIMGADIGLVNGGGIRADIAAGDITYGDIISVHPFGNMMCMAELTGQDILDALEYGAMQYPNENGGFLQVSGLTYEIHSYIPSSVVISDRQEFTGIEGEYRVKNVMVNGEPLDPEKTYTVASHNYYLKNGGDGFAMFKGAKLVRDEVLIDNQLLINYIVDELDGVVGDEYADPLGQGRITICTKAPEVTESTESPEDTAETTEAGETDNPATGNGGITAGMIVVLAAGVALATSRRRS